MNRPRIAITMGDPAGVGPEICLDALGNASMAEQCVPIVIGDHCVLEACAAASVKNFAAPTIGVDEISSCDEPAVVDLQRITMDDFQPGAINPASSGREYAPRHDCEKWSRLREMTTRSGAAACNVVSVRA